MAAGASAAARSAPRCAHAPPRSHRRPRLTVAVPVRQEAYDPSKEAARPQMASEDKAKGKAKGKAKKKKAEEEEGAASAEAEKPQEMNLDGPLDLTLMKRKVAARAYAQDGTQEQRLVGLREPTHFPDWAKFVADGAAMCEPVLAQQPASTVAGSYYREAQKLLELCRTAAEGLEKRHAEERAHMGTLARYARRMDSNQLPAMQGEWRKKPYALRDYTPICTYVPVEGLNPQEAQDVMSQLDTELEGLLSYTYSYEDKTNDAQREIGAAQLKLAGVSDDEVVRAEVSAVLEDLVERVGWSHCDQHPSVRQRGLQIGKELAEVAVWGMDSYSRRNVELALDDLPTPMPDRQRSLWIERTLAPAINRQGTEGWDMRAALNDLLAKATTEEERARASVVLNSLNDLGDEHFRIHPKGTGVTCSSPEGIKAQEFVTEYLGELVPPWRWFEKQEAVEAAQKHYGQKPTLPDFYNMLMERHRDDSRGYAVLYIDAAERNNFASSLSHSCDPNCRTTVAAIGKRYSVCLYTVRDIEEGEELTIDYSAATENEKEFRSAVCLCGSHACRGSFLYFTGANESQQYKNRYHSIVDRFAQILLCSSGNSLLVPVQHIMNRHGLRSLCVGNTPEWAQKFVALALLFVDNERGSLPIELLRAPPIQGQKHDYKSADVESRQMLEQRVQNLAVTMSRLRHFLDHQLALVTDPAKGYDRRLPVLQMESTTEEVRIQPQELSCVLLLTFACAVCRNRKRSRRRNPNSRRRRPSRSRRRPCRLRRTRPKRSSR